MFQNIVRSQNLMKSSLIFLPNSLFTLGLAHFGLLIPLGHDVLKSCANHGPLELLGPLGAFLGRLLFNTLLVLTPIKHRPGYLARIPLQKVSFHATTIQKLEHLAIRLDQSPSTARIYLVATVSTEFDPKEREWRLLFVHKKLPRQRNHRRFDTIF